MQSTALFEQWLGYETDSSRAHSLVVLPVALLLPLMRGRPSWPLVLPSLQPMEKRTVVNAGVVETCIKM